MIFDLVIEQAKTAEGWQSSVILSLGPIQVGHLLLASLRQEVHAGPSSRVPVSSADELQCMEWAVSSLGRTVFPICMASWESWWLVKWLV